MTQDFDFEAFAVEGSMGAVFRSIYGMVKGMIKDPVAPFMRMVVVDVISDPTQINENKIAYWQNVLRVKNYQLSTLLPRNAIIAQRVRNSRTTFDDPMILFPFFPSHFSLPCKPGEIVWAMFEDPNAIENNLGFWFCRIAEPHITDDVNHTHAASRLDESNVKTLVNTANGTHKVRYEMHNGRVVQYNDGRREVSPGTETISLPNDFSTPDVFEKLITETDSSKLIQYEPVPRFKKRPGDIALEGTNNALIVLGTDRSGPHANYQTIEQIKQFGNIPTLPEKFKEKAGAIDLVAGRGNASVSAVTGTPPKPGIYPTGGTAVSTTSINSSEKNQREIKKEIAKFPPELVSPTEGDPDYSADSSRILISQRTQVDEKFKLSGYNSAKLQIADSPQGDAAVTIKTDKVRIIARSDISLIVTNFKYQPGSIDESTPGYNADETDQTKWASITIKTNGDIVFTPSRLGVIKLGGDDADKAILCTNYAAPPVTEATQGDIKNVTPLYTTGNSQVGTNKPGQGTFAAKVLVK
jgi:hypothetical protein